MYDTADTKTCQNLNNQINPRNEKMSRCEYGVDCGYMVKKSMLDNGFSSWEPELTKSMLSPSLDVLGYFVHFRRYITKGSLTGLGRSESNLIYANRWWNKRDNVVCRTQVTRLLGFNIVFDTALTGLDVLS